jgi:hypothetical protein
MFSDAEKDTFITIGVFNTIVGLGGNRFCLIGGLIFFLTGLIWKYSLSIKIERRK